MNGSHKVRFRLLTAEEAARAAAGGPNPSLADLLVPESRLVDFGLPRIKLPSKRGGHPGDFANGTVNNIPGSSVASASSPSVSGVSGLPVTASFGVPALPSTRPTGSAKRKAGIIPPNPQSHQSTPFTSSHAPPAMRVNSRALHDGVRLWGYKGQGNDRGALEWPGSGPVRNARATSSTALSPPMTPKTKHKHKRKAPLASQASTARLIRLGDEPISPPGGAGPRTVAAAVAAAAADKGKEKEKEKEKERDKDAVKEPSKRPKKERGGSKSREGSPAANPPADPSTMKRTRSNGSANLHIPASLVHAFPQVQNGHAQQQAARRSLPPPSPLRASAVPVFQQMLERGKREREKEAQRERESEQEAKGSDATSAETAGRGADDRMDADTQPPKLPNGKSIVSPKAISPRRSPRNSDTAIPEDAAVDINTIPPPIPPITLRRTVSQDPPTLAQSVDRPTRSNSLGRASLTESSLGLPDAEALEMARTASANGRARRETTMPRNLRDYDTKITA